MRARALPSVQAGEGGRFCNAGERETESGVRGSIREKRAFYDQGCPTHTFACRSLRSIFILIGVVHQIGGMAMYREA